LTRSQLDCQREAIQLSAHFRDKRRLLVGESKASRSRRYAPNKQLHGRISKHRIYRLLRAVWWTVKGKNPVTMFTLYFQRFSARGQKKDLLRFLVELFGNQSDRLDHVLTAIENDKKLSRTNELDQFQAWILRFECESQRCRDSPRNMSPIGKASQVNKMDLAAKLVGEGAAHGQGNGRLTDAAGAEQCYEPLISKRVANLADDRFAPNHHERSDGPAPVSGPVAAALRTACERDDGADERVAPPFDVCDVAVAKLAVAKRFADCGHVDPDADLLHGHVRPDVIDKLLLRNHLTLTLGEVDQDVQGPAADWQHYTVAPQRPLPARKLKGAKL
jgi:hypothetical protein